MSCFSSTISKYMLVKGKRRCKRQTLNQGLNTKKAWNAIELWLKPASLKYKRAELFPFSETFDDLPQNFFSTINQGHGLYRISTSEVAEVITKAR